jgi:hypothetical protein
MSLNKCQNCGCEDALVTLPPCPTPAGCPDPEPCSEVFDAQCIIYTGADIDCGDDTVVPADTNVATALNDITDYFCSSIATVTVDITTIEGDITTIEGDITAIEGDITTIEGNIATLQANQGLFDTGFRVALDPTITINTVTPSLFDSNITTGTVILFPLGDVEYQIVDGTTTTQYNPATGIWTCPQTGKYDINYNVYLTAPSQAAFGWGDTPTTTGAAYSIGVTSPGATGTTVYCADTFTIVKGVYVSRIYLTGGVQGINITANTQLVLRHQNMTGINYTGISGDNIDFAIRRVG